MPRRRAERSIRIPVVTRQVVEDLVPDRLRAGEDVLLRPDARIAVDGAEADGDLRPVGILATEEARPADAAERLDRALLRPEHAHEVGPFEHMELLPLHAP